MNFLAALSALMALPATTRLSVARLEPDDVIVMECDGILSHEGFAAIKSALRGVWPEPRKVVVLDRKSRLKVVSGA